MKRIRRAALKLLKRHISLIEVLIGMVLTVLVLTTLLFFYQQINVISIDIDKVKKEHFQLRYVENRLSSILPRAINEKDKKEFTFFSLNDEGISLNGSQSLIFTFDNDVSRDSVFSNNVIGRLYLDKQGFLTLAYWPSPKRQEKGSPVPMKKEVLLEGVDSLDFEFFIPPEKLGEANLNKAHDNPSPEPKGGWRKQLWLKEFKKLPAMVKMNVGIKETNDGKKEVLSFVFPLVNSVTPVIYDQ